MRLESGPAAYDRNFNVAVALLGVFLGSWFLYDHYVGYANKNRKTAEQWLIPKIGKENIPAQLPDKPDEDEFNRLRAQEPSDPSKIREAWGEPSHIVAGGNEIWHYYPSKYGAAYFPIVNNRVDLKRMLWVGWDHSRDDIQMQFYLAFVGYVFALYFLRRVYKAATLRVIIDDEGLVYAGRRVPFASMTKFTNYSKKGWVDLFYEQGGQERKIRFDNQKVRKFDEIIDELCRAKGFADPRKAEDEKDDQADKKA